MKSFWDINPLFEIRDFQWLNLWLPVPHAEIRPSDLAYWDECHDWSNRSHYYGVA